LKTPRFTRERAPGSVPDAVGSAAQVEVLLEHVDPRVVDTIARWRDVDPHSLHGLADSLITKSGDPAVDSAGYLSALHGFVAERLTVDALSPTHAVVFPHATNVPGWDLIVDGHYVQIKEGSTAYEMVQHALERYPEIRSFATDPSTAHRLQMEGIDATGVPGLEPSHLDSITTNTLHGLGAAEAAGAIHVPVLTTVFSMCRYWERFNAGRIDARSAVAYGSTDIAAQALGSALGLKLGAIYVVATGTFALSALPLTAAAIAGGLGLRHLVNRKRSTKFGQALSQLDVVRDAAETASEIAIQLSREYISMRLAQLQRVAERARTAADRRWEAEVANGALEASNDLYSLCLEALADQPPNPNTRIWSRELETASSTPEPAERAIALYNRLQDFKTSFRLSHAFQIHAGHIAARQQERCRRLYEVSTELAAQLEAAETNNRRDVAVELAAEYLLLLERLSQFAAPVLAAVEQVRSEAEKLGKRWAL
jgi:hypothetical protein